jgi:hypothetical protein
MHRAIVAVDLESSTTRTNLVKGELRRTLYDVLARALEAAGITRGPQEQVTDRREPRRISVDQDFKDLLETSSLGTPAARRIRASTPVAVVEDVRGRRAERNPPPASPRLAAYLDGLTDRGDGVLVLIRPDDDMPKTVLVDRLIPLLTALLIEHNAAATHPALRIRLRAVVHAGEIHDDGRGFYGEAIDLAIRLNDSAPVKKSLKQTTSPLVLVVSDEIYSGIIAHGYSDPGPYRPLVRVRVGNRRHRGWVHIPNPVGAAIPETIRQPARTGRLPSLAMEDERVIECYVV